MYREMIPMISSSIFAITFKEWDIMIDAVMDVFMLSNMMKFIPFY